MAGFCRIPRAILDMDPVTWQVLVYLVSRAAWRPEKREVPGAQGRYVNLGRGEVLVGRRSLAQALERGERATRTALARLEEKRAVTRQKTSHLPSHLGSIYLVNNFDSYNGKNEETTRCPSHSRPTAVPPKLGKCCVSRAPESERISKVEEEEKTGHPGSREGERQGGREGEKRLEDLGLGFLLRPKPEMSPVTRDMLAARRPGCAPGAQPLESAQAALTAEQAKELEEELARVRAHHQAGRVQ